MELNDPAIDFVGLARSLGIEADRAKTVNDATDLIEKALEGGTPAPDRRRAGAGIPVVFHARTRLR